jgi:uncharacterized protein (TIGR03435 family)
MKRLNQFLERYGEISAEEMESAAERAWGSVVSGEAPRIKEAPEDAVRPERGWGWLAVATIAAAIVIAVLVPVWMMQRAPAMESSNPVVAIAENEAKIFTLKDGSRLNLRPGSELSFSDGCTRLVRGDLFVNAAKQKAGRHLCVQTKDFIVTVVGTIFTVSVEEKGSSVVVEEGTVWVQQGTTKKTLVAGQRFSTIVAKPEAPLRQSRQPATPSPQQFDAVSIKKTPPDQRFFNNRVSPAGYRANRTTLKDMVLLAYDLRPFQVSGGPAWIDTEQFAVEAKVPSDVGTKFQSVLETGSDEEARQAVATFQSIFQPMMQDMLATRFKLKVRRTTEQASAYALVINGETSKLQPATSEGAELSPGGLFKGSASIGELAQYLSMALGQPVVDRTGLTGVYNIDLHFEREVDRERRTAQGNAPGGGGRGRGDGALVDDPDVFTALREQLGLKLEATKAPVQFLVIESVEQPSEN